MAANIGLINERLVKAAPKGGKVEPLQPMSDFSPGLAAGLEGGWFACARPQRQRAQTNLDHRS